MLIAICVDTRSAGIPNAMIAIINTSRIGRDEIKLVRMAEFRFVKSEEAAGGISCSGSR